MPGWGCTQAGLMSQGMRAARLECGWGLWIYRITLPFLKHLDGIEGSQTGHRAHEPDAKWFSKGRGCGSHLRLTPRNVNCLLHQTYGLFVQFGSFL